MNIILLSGKEIKINLKKYLTSRSNYCKSKFQEKIREELFDKYPLENIFEEVYIKGEGFFLDFLIPSLGLVFEVNGRQHINHVKFFHKTKIEFHKQQEVDKKKKEFCELNNLKLIEIYDGK